MINKRDNRLRGVVFFIIVPAIVAVFYIASSKRKVGNVGISNIITIPTLFSKKQIFLSCSQSAEDLLLSSIFSDVSRGFYIDVGANHPTRWSDTKIFYERGWSGINIEPLDMYCKALKQQRPRDVNVCGALGERHGEMILYQHDALSTLKKEIADSLESSKNFTFPPKLVAVYTLTEICERYCSENTVINFLKIDVEGFEYEVLKGTDFSRWKPQVIQLEGIEPASKRQTYLDFEPLLFEAGYEFVYEHWLDRWYIHHNYSYLKRNLRRIEDLMKQYTVVKVP